MSNLSIVKSCFILLLICLVVWISGCIGNSDTGSNTNTTTNIKTNTSAIVLSQYDDGEFSFYYPADMEVQQLAIIDIGEYPDFSPLLDNKSMVQVVMIEKWYPSIYLSIQKTPKTSDLEFSKVIATLKKNIVESPSTQSVTFDRNLTISGSPAYLIRSEGKYQAGNEREYVEEVLIVDKNSFLYIIYITLRGGIITNDDEKIFDTYSTKILEKFEIRG
ncbi:MAG: hypothetical protein FJW63_08410 [Actinobacteria bacterium]|nr:hypothetical protein [Actinomycetota bacterium]